MSTVRKLARLAEVEAVQWLPRARIEALQLARLKRIVAFAEVNVPLYRESFRAAGVAARDLRTLADLRHFPLLSREDVVAAWPDGILSRKPRPDDVVFRTSGTSGLFMQIAYAADAADFLDAVYARALFATGYRPLDRIAYFWWDGEAKPLRFYERLGLMRKHLLPVHPDPQKQLDEIVALDPAVIYHFPSALLLIGKLALSERVRPRLVICHGELMTDEQQATLTRTFGCPVFNQYGAQEFNRMAWDCKRHAGLHVDADSVCIEIVRDDEVLGAEEEGELVVTGLVNTLMPLIRYRIGDVGRMLRDPCSCGRGLPLMKLTEGRADDVLVLPNGQRIGPRTLAPRIEDLSGFLQYRVTQTTPTHIDVAIVRELGAEGVEARVREVVRGIVGEGIDVDVRAVDEISLSRRGKLRKIIRGFSTTI